MKVHNCYEVNKDTMAVIPEGKNSRIYELDNEFLVKKGVNEVMEESCEYFGSTLEGRQKATMKMTGLSYKVPIIVEESNKLIFFPTSSLKSDNCSWLSFKFVDRFYKVGDKVCIEFKNGKKVLIPVSYTIIDNQLIRSFKLYSILENRIKNSEKTF